MNTPEQHDAKLVACAVRRYALTVHQAHLFVETCTSDQLLQLTRDVYDMDEKERRRWITTVDVVFAWYDFWVGVYWDRKKRTAYICPLPMVCVVVKLPEQRKKA